MKVQVEELSAIKKKLFIEVSDEEYLKELDQAYDRLQKKVTVKGFRKGKVPRTILERYYKDSTESEVLTHLIEHSYLWALRDQKVAAVAPPKISDLKNNGAKGLSYVAEVEIRPIVQISKYKNIPLKKSPIQIKEEELSRELEALRQAHAQIIPVSGETPLQSGQIAIVDFVGRLQGQPFEGGSAKGVSIEVGAGRFIPDFEQGLIGAKKGETKMIMVHFPPDYPSPELAGRETEFEVHLNDIKEKVLPELNDDFARDLGKFDSLAEVKEKIRGHMHQQKEQETRGELYHQVLDYLIQEHSFDVPEGMIEQELNAMLENTKRHLAQQKLTLEQAGITPDQFRAKNHEAAIRRVKSFLLFEAVAQAEKIEVSSEELNARLDQIAKSMGQPREVVERYYREHQMFPMIYTQILEEKILDFLLSQSKITEA